MAFPPGILNCSSPTCSHHHEALDSYSQHLVSTVLECASQCIPMHKSTPGAVRNLTGWNHGADKLKEATRFWHKVWEEAGCPSSGVLFNVKKHSKARFKYAVHRLKRRQHILLREKLARSFASKNFNKFWDDVRRLNKSKSSSPPVVDGVRDSKIISSIFASKFDRLLNIHPTSSSKNLYSSIHSLVTESLLSAVEFSEE